ncbi:hypothetical protein [Desulfovibrio sp. TomC]|uniref:hypothetical protein n=1 Tax=Desulfovibrio sp. TomC TaxID=1562888 RepID=UPI000573468F|nr:hypothetical protein [Desulfovibrio sp. TomC]KHK00611.1 General secretion pathway protein A [Desulfovibrio sp. TomC]
MDKPGIPTDSDQTIAAATGTDRTVRQRGGVGLALALAAWGSLAPLAVFPTQARAAASAVSGPSDKTSPQAQAQSQPQVQEQPQAAAPVFLGMAAVPPDWSVAEAARRIYGYVDGQVLARVALANPGPADPRRVRPQRQLLFPALAACPLPPVGSRLVRVARKADLAAGLALVRQTQDEGVRLRLCLHFHPTYGLACDVIVDETYADPAAAHAALAGLPPGLAQNAVLLDGFLPGTMLYSSLPQPRSCPAPAIPAGPAVFAQTAAQGLRDVPYCLP